MSNVSFSNALFVVRGQDRGRRFNLDRTTITIGRHGTNDIQLFDGKASRRHARIVFEGARHKLIDLGASNGTFVNEERVEETVLNGGDKITIGGTVLLFSEGVSSKQTARDARTVNSEHEIVSETIEQESSVLQSVKADRILDYSQIFSGDSGIGIEETHDRLRILYKASLDNSTSFDLDELLERMLDLIFEMIQVQYGCVMLTSEDDQLEIKARASKSTPNAQSLRQVEIPKEILQRVIDRDEGVLAIRECEIENRVEKRQFICTPMIGRYGRVGLIFVESALDQQTQSSEGHDSLPSRFDEQHLKLVLTIGKQVGLAIEEKIFSEAMIHSERMAAIGETVAMMSHQIKNIMQGMGGAGFMIKNGIADNDTKSIKKGWRIVEKNQQRISDLILNMLSFSKERKPSFQLNDIVVTVGEAIEMSEEYAKEHQVLIHYEPVPSIVLYYDSEMIGRAIHNVILNAIDACVESENEKKIEVSISEIRNGSCTISVVDSGVGIPEEEIEKIFSPYKSTKGGRGTGLGLTIARKNFREHGGGVTVTSEPGIGTSFFLSLPFWNNDNIPGNIDGSEGEATVTRFHDLN